MLWQIHPVGHGNDVELGIAHSRPVEEIVHYVLFRGKELIELVHEYDATC